MLPDRAPPRVLSLPPDDKEQPHPHTMRGASQITDIAPDANECCSLAKKLALRLADGFANGIISTSVKTEEVRTHTTAGVGDGAGEDKVNLFNPQLEK